jgi:hypothetical protein
MVGDWEVDFRLARYPPIVQEMDHLSDVTWRRSGPELQNA